MIYLVLFNMKKLLFFFLIFFSNFIFAINEIVALKGQVLINNELANLNTPINAGDQIETKHDGYIKFSFMDSAYEVKKNSFFILPINSKETVGNLLKGSLLAAFKKGGERKLKISHGTLSIRGTGVHVESGIDHDAVCLCYGEIDLLTNKQTVHLDTEKKYHMIVHIKADGTPYLPDLNSCKFDHWSRENIALEKIIGNPSPFKRSIKQFLY